MIIEYATYLALIILGFLAGFGYVHDPVPKYYGAKVIEVREVSRGDLSCAGERKTLYKITEGPAEGALFDVCGSRGSVGSEFKVKQPW